MSAYRGLILKQSNNDNTVSAVTCTGADSVPIHAPAKRAHDTAKRPGLSTWTYEPSNGGST